MNPLTAGQSIRAMRRRLTLGFMIAAISAVILLSAWLFLPKALVRYHLRAIEQDRNLPRHIAPLVRLGRLARPERFRVLDEQRQRGHEAMMSVNSHGSKRCAASALVLATAYEAKELRPDACRAFIRSTFAARIGGSIRNLYRVCSQCGLNPPAIGERLWTGSPDCAFDSTRHCLSTIVWRFQFTAGQ
jgi:hypothetical protein